MNLVYIKSFSKSLKIRESRSTGSGKSNSGNEPEGGIMKFKGLNNGQRQAVITKVCVAGRIPLPGAPDEEILQGVLSGDLEIVVQKAMQILFDRHGRRIPPRGLVAAVCDPNRDFRLDQPSLDYANRLARLEQAGLPAGISAAEFEARASALLLAISQNSRIKNLLNGVYLPIVIPQMDIANLGEVTEKLVEAAGASYLQQFPNRSFTNHRKGELAGQATIVSGSRYEQLLACLDKGAVVGYFPACLQGFSVHAQREQMVALPEDFILSGPLDAAIGWMMYPDILGRDFQTPGYDCSAVNWQLADYSLDFKANDDVADFGYGAYLGRAYDYDSGGLLLLG